MTLLQGAPNNNNSNIQLNDSSGGDFNAGFFRQMEESSLFKHEYEMLGTKQVCNDTIKKSRPLFRDSRLDIRNQMKVSTPCHIGRSGEAEEDWIGKY